MLKVLIIEKITCNYIWWQILPLRQTYCGNHFAKYTTPNHYIIPLRLIQCYMSIIYTLKKNKTLKRSKLRCIIASVKKQKTESWKKRKQWSLSKINSWFLLGTVKPKVLLGWHTKMANEKDCNQEFYIQ